MKKAIILIIGILFISCSSTQVEKKVIDDFLKNEPRTKNTDVLVEEAYPRTKALQYYENAYKERNLYEGEIRFAPNGYPPYKWEIDTVETNQLKKKYQNDNLIYHWKKGDFANQKLVIIPDKSIMKPENRKYNYGIYLSRPLITKDKKYAFLFYVSFAVGSGGSDEKAVLLKKVNGTWIELNFYYNTKEFN